MIRGGFKQVVENCGVADGKSPKVIFVAVARKLLLYAHPVVRTLKPFQPFSDALLQIDRSQDFMGGEQP